MREMEGGKTVSVGAVYVPNSYTIHLAPEDFERLEGLIPTLRDEFSTLLRNTAAERRWHLPGALVVRFEQDRSISSGRFEVDASHDASAQAPAFAPGPNDVIRLVGSHPPEHWVLASDHMSIGRLPACDIHVDDQNASRQHAEIVRRDDGWWLVDLDSTNGTLVNGTLIKERRLAPGDRIQIGSSHLEYGTEERVEAPRAHPAPEIPDATQASPGPSSGPWAPPEWSPNGD